ncbi:MAG: hypothetical protein SGJ21_01980 [Alphaproteobacteria bacterium]|nr:hypothetical protein [Alphaproteobacteria bacterium]
MAGPIVENVEPGPKVTGAEAKQGQNVRGMLIVLAVSILLVATAFAVMVATSTNSEEGQRDGTAAEITTPVTGAPPPAQ